MLVANAEGNGEDVDAFAFLIGSLPLLFNRRAGDACNNAVKPHVAACAYEGVSLIHR